MLMLKKRVVIKTIKVFSCFSCTGLARHYEGLIACKRIVEALQKHKEVVLDFQNVNCVSHGFVDAMLGTLLRQYGPQLLRRLTIINHNTSVKAVIRSVILHSLRDCGRPKPNIVNLIAIKGKGRIQT